MSSIIEPDSERQRYETKTVKYDEDGPGAYTIMMTRFTPDGNEPLSDSGYRDGVYVLYALLGGGVRDASTDVYPFVRQISSTRDDALKAMLYSAKSQAGWERIEDGQTYTQSEAERIFD